MPDRTRTSAHSLFLHTALIAGSVVFALPYAWLVGTSWKLDTEVRSDDIELLPDKPVPATSSPYINERVFDPITRPRRVTAERWSTFVENTVRTEIDKRIHAWIEKRDTHQEPKGLRETLRRGVFERLVAQIGDDIWTSADEATLADTLDAVITPSMVTDAFNEAYRFFALGEIRLQTRDYRIDKPVADTSIDTAWTLRGPAQLRPSRQASKDVSVVHYDLSQADQFTIETRRRTLPDLADPLTGFRRLELSYRSDQSWHEMRVAIEFGGKRYLATEPVYLTEDQWTQTAFQLPSADDDRLMPRRYVLLTEDANAEAIDHGPDAMHVTLTVTRSSTPEALWAKGTMNYRRAFDEVPFARYLKTSIFLVIVNILGTLLSCSLAAYAFARLNWPGRDVCFLLVLATLMIPPQVTMIPSFVIYKYLGWYNTLMPLWAPSCLAVNGFAIFLLRQAMKGIPKDLEEAAKIDGCSHWRIYCHIILPLVKPTLAAISIFTFMFVWNDFLTPLIYVNDQRLYPLALGLFSFMAGRENQFTLIMAGSVIMTLPVIIIFFLAQRHFIQGVAMSGMKN